MDETDIGHFKAPVAVFKTPKGMDWQLVVTRIVGADGVDDKCPPFFGFKGNIGHCALQLKMDCAKIEDEIAAKLRAEGTRPHWDTLDLESAKRIAAAPSAAAPRATPADPAAPASAPTPPAADPPAATPAPAAPPI